MATPREYTPLDATEHVDPDYLGTGSPDGTKVLYGDQTWAVPPGGSGAMVVQEADSTVAAAATTLDFGHGLDVSESPANEANIDVDESELNHALLGGVSANQHHNQSHVLADGTSLGADHTTSGLTAGWVLRALSATTAKFMQLVHGDLGSVGVNDHHNRDHASTHGPAAADALKLDDLAAPDDNTDLDASTSAHGLLKKFPGGTTDFLRADGAFATPSVSGGTVVVQENDSTVDAAAATLDFEHGLDVTSSPSGEANIAVDESELDHSLLGNVTANQHHNQSHDHSASGDGTALVPATFTVPGGGKFSAGSSMPGSPASGDRVWRTDLRMEFFYDGTRWLSTTLYSCQVLVADALFPLSATSTNQRNATPPLMGGTDLWIEGWTCAYFVASGGTALDASNKWVGSLAAARSGGVTTDALATITVASGSSNQWLALSGTINALLDNGTTHVEIVCTWTKTGTPGTFRGFPVLTYRIVST